MVITNFYLFKSSQTNERESSREPAGFLLIAGIVRVDSLAFAHCLRPTVITAAGTQSWLGLPPAVTLVESNGHRQAEAGSFEVWARFLVGLRLPDPFRGTPAQDRDRQQ